MSQLRDTVARLIVEANYNIPPDILQRLRCIAQARKDRGTIAYLAQLDSTPLNCDSVTIPY